MAVSLNLPATQRAIVANDELNYSIRDDVSLPPLSPDSVIIKTSMSASIPSTQRWWDHSLAQELPTV